ncbi:hypothetical protein, partial [Sphingobacterium multivorum]|uniref:hypothetical protein n=1 Tax=Sphingobacterium multivorum TaxID=28454 RepID=UPI0028A25D87
SVPFFTRKPLLETVKGFLRLDTCLYFPVQAIAYLPYPPTGAVPQQCDASVNQIFGGHYTSYL